MDRFRRSPLALVGLVVVIVAALAVAWTRFRAATTVPKADTVQMGADELRKAMER
ncbi:MAG: hypothetical protein HUU17_02165 [Chthonomonadales bacterium]|nr:hypothetical protein [Chthonomonadales bacterium]